MSALLEAIAAAETVAGAPAGADVEWVWDGAGLWIVGLAATWDPAGRIGGAQPGDAGRTFALDGEHNPAPLTPATESLAHHLSARRALPYRMCTYDGWLYGTRPDPVATRSLGAVASAAAIEEALIAVEAGAPASLDEAALAAELERRLEAFSIFAERYFAATTDVRQIRDQLERFLLREVPAQAGRVGTLLGGVGGAGPERDATLALAGVDHVRGVLARFGSFAPGWDLVFPTHAEEPAPLAAAAVALSATEIGERRRAARGAAEAALEEVQQALAPEKRAELRALCTAARAAAASLELDDLSFARGISALRAPVAEAGRRLAARGDLDQAEDAFFLGLRQAAEAVRAAPGTLALASVARAARARWIARRLRPPPARIAGGRPEAPAVGAAGAVRQGTAASHGAARGRAKVLHSPGVEGPLPPGCVLVCPAATPAYSYLLLQVVAVVTEHGGALSHAAVLAREYGVPAVVAVPGLMRWVRDGDDLLVDGTAGTVRKME